ncbi:hypothetical protein [Methylomicrobium sp. Wu6]|uniref:hypothetical protein n=1 Tax=Methylomicrobium sp. Wu6 TaxID=3107928 RepID=UPI002DD69673|nr:hypothetical protein [Methylomicrobium sp. Wu6]MEC4747493.1 hypothetical protein [Methylomicrobium sp. Wu6]
MKITAKKASAAITLIIALILTTPVCGLLFGCGCAWPWSGFFFGCDYFDPAAEHRCPWCASTFSGGLSVVLSAAFGMIAALAPFTAPTHRSASEYLLRIGAGMLIFLCTAILSGWLAAHSQHYPFAPRATQHPDLIRRRINADKSQSIPHAR